MGKKEASKGREWEKGRRNILNQKFFELHQVLPSYVEGQSISKKTILTQALSFIHQCRQEKKVPQKQGGDVSDLEALQKWVPHILGKFFQLVSLLSSLNVKVPKDYTLIEAPPMSINPEITSLLKNIGISGTEDQLESLKNGIKQKRKANRKKKSNLNGDIDSSLNSNEKNSSSKKDLSVLGANVTGFQSSESGQSSNLNSNSSIIQGNSVMVQPTPLQMTPQLVFASNPASSSLSAPLPLLVSVTGVKTVNPFILVQSNVMTPTPPSTQKPVSSRGSIRPIQPGPPNKSAKKLKKVPIPSLKHKSVFLSNILPHSNSRRLLKKDSSSSSVKPTSNKKVTKPKTALNGVPVKVSTVSTDQRIESLENKMKNDQKLVETSSNISSMNIHKLSSETILDGDKENIVKSSLKSKRDCDGNKANHLSSVPLAIKEVHAAPNLINAGPLKDADVKTATEKSVPLADFNGGDGTVSEQEKAGMKVAEDACSTSSAHKRLCEDDLGHKSVKRSKCFTDESNSNRTKSNLDNVNNLFNSNESESPVKMSKSNYTISALCAQQQQLLQNKGISPEGAATLPEMPHEKILMAPATKQATEESKSKEISSEKTNGNSYTLGKSKEFAPLSTDLYPEWVDKSKPKSDRICHSYNLFSSLPLHNNKNTFIPISDIDNFKTVPESFDSNDASFGLPLHSSDISSDIFASLQVPSGGQHPESISPTAAFLLAFPLVSTSKATELLSDDTVCENTDSQPGMKTILQIGNLDCDTPVTKCVSVYSALESNNVVYSTTTVFNQESSSISLMKNKSLNSASDVSNFSDKNNEGNSSHKPSSQENHSALSNSVNEGMKVLESSVPLKANQPLHSKIDFQSSCQNSNKENCPTRHGSGSSSMDPVLHQTTTQLQLSRLPNKQQDAQLPSSQNIFNKLSLKENNEHEPTTFLTCNKQNDWIEVPHTSHSTFPDFPREFPTSSSSHSDCSVNYVVPSLSISSSTSGTELVSGSRSQTSSSGGILSWSTLSQTDYSQSMKHMQKSVHYQDLVPSSKPSSKPVESHQLSSNPTMTTTISNHSQVGPSNVVIGQRSITAIPTYQNHHVDNSTKPGTSLPYNHGEIFSQKQATVLQQHTSSVSFISSGKNSEGKKSFSASAERKRVECSPLINSNSSESGHFTHRPQGASQGAPQSNSMLGYTVADTKNVKASNTYYDERLSSQNMKPGMNVISESHHSKQPLNSQPYSQSSAVSELKHAPVVSSYSHAGNISMKETVGQSHTMHAYNHQAVNLPRQHNFPTADSKKNATQFNQQCPTAVSKQTSSGLNINLENTSTVMQFSSSTVSAVQVHEQAYEKPNGPNEQPVKSQQNVVASQSQLRQPVNPQHQQQQCDRSSSKESVTNLHRPPVNWMTAPDIRSHQHHSGPSFGNSANMNNSQALHYLPEHSKDSDGTTSIFDQSTNFHCVDIPYLGQSLYKGNELHLFGNETMENFHDNSGWSPNKNGGSSMLGNMIIPSTLPTLVGDLALGDNNISRPFLPSYASDPQLCPKKPLRRALHSSRRTDKVVEETHVVPGQECAGSFLSVSQLVDTSNVSKTKSGSSTKETNTAFSGQYNDETMLCQASKQSSSKPVSSNYSTEALLSSSNAQQMNQLSHRKKRSHGGHYTNNFVGGGICYQNSSATSTYQGQGPQPQFLTDLPPPRSNDYQSTFLHSDSVPSVMLGNPSRSHRNHTYSLQNVSDRPSEENNSNVQRTHHSSNVTEASGGSSAARHRTSNNNSVHNVTTSVTMPSSSNIMDFGYINVPPTMLQDDINFSNHPPPHPPPPFLPHHSYAMPQDTIYSAPRLHPPQNSNIQSPSASALTNFHLSAIFPEINEKVIC